MITLYEFPASGHCHKIRLMLALLELEYVSIVVDGNSQAHKSPEFLRMNPFGEVPVLTDDTVVLRDSQAILYYLAQTYRAGTWMPADPGAAANVIGWLSTAANEVTRGPNMLRLHHKFGRAIDEPSATAITKALFQMLENYLSQHTWLVGAAPTIADIAMYPYLALAPEGQWDLVPYPVVRAWLGRVRALPGYVGMPGMYEGT